MRLKAERNWVLHRTSVGKVEKWFLPKLQDLHDVHGFEEESAFVTFISRVWLVKMKNMLVTPCLSMSGYPHLECRGSPTVSSRGKGLKGKRG